MQTMLIVVVCIAFILQVVRCEIVGDGTHVSEKTTVKSWSEYWHGQKESIGESKEGVILAPQSYVAKALANVGSHFNYLRGIREETIPYPYTCPAGQYVGNGGCTGCPAGSFNPGYVPPGLIQWVYKTMPGYGVGEVAINCWSCAVGTYNPNVGASACLPCTTGCTCSACNYYAYTTICNGDSFGVTNPICPKPTNAPTAKPTAMPTTAYPTAKPTTASPTYMPSTLTPTAKPSTKTPTCVPTTSPTFVPTTAKPSAKPSTASPTAVPTVKPTTATPTYRPTQTYSPSTARPSLTPTTAVPTITQKTISAFAGTGTMGNSGDGGQATSATFCSPNAIALDTSLNSYITDPCYNTIRVVNKGTGIVSIYAGSGQAGSTGDGGKATNAKLNFPFGVAVDSTNNNLYIADQSNCKIRMVTQSTSIITTYAGTGACDSAGDGGKATSAKLQGPAGLATDPSGNLYIADYYNSMIRMVTKSTGIISTVAGGGKTNTGCGSCPGCNWYQCPNPSILATNANLYNTMAVALDSAGNMYISSGQMVFMVTKSTGIMTLLAGNYYLTGPDGDNGPASSALLNNPKGLAVDASGNVYIADASNYVVRKIVKSTGTIVTVAGINDRIQGMTGNSGNGGFGNQARLGCPSGLVIDASGIVYIADACNNNVRKLA